MVSDTTKNLQNLFGLNGRNALISGGSKGIGKAIAVRFAEAGANVGIIGRDLEGLTQTRDLVASMGRECIVVKADLAHSRGIDEAAQIAMRYSLNWHILVNNAGIAKQAPLLEMQEEDWDSVQHVNLKATFLLSQKIVPAMIRNGGGKIINISSLGSFFGTPGLGAYAVSKSGINQITRTMASEWGPKNIQANAICPTIILTEMARKIWRTDQDKEMYDQLVKKIPAGRFGTTDDVANLALFLAGQASNYINGTSIPLDGGKLALP
ncbi:MAG: SDR family NAD(P)-dependent oxidoreductase [Bacteroidales bacterium]